MKNGARMSRCRQAASARPSIYAPAQPGVTRRGWRPPRAGAAVRVAAIRKRGGTPPFSLPYSLLCAARGMESELIELILTRPSRHTFCSAGAGALWCVSAARRWPRGMARELPGVDGPWATPLPNAAMSTDGLLTSPGVGGGKRATAAIADGLSAPLIQSSSTLPPRTAELPSVTSASSSFVRSPPMPAAAPAPGRRRGLARTHSLSLSPAPPRPRLCWLTTRPPAPASHTLRA